MKVIKFNNKDLPIQIEFNAEEADRLLRTQEKMIKDNTGQYYTLQWYVEEGQTFTGIFLPSECPRTYEILDL